MYTLGINAAYHDPAACLVRDGVVLAAAEEERFTHVKHGKRPVPFSTWELPFHAIDYCLREAGIDLVDVDHVAYSYDPQPARRPAPRRQRRSRFRWSPAPIRFPRSGKRPGTRSSSRRSSTRRDNWPTGTRTTCGSGSAELAPMALTAGTSSRTTWRTRPAPSTPRRSSTPRS